ncbi:hypothetical protein [Natronomonas salina]|uniref:phage NrS-1 polymerase family protein n=1 Tax=Natronomonas salina TaxID=1710540 RepID=UPI001FECA383|nr:hypothetical protein [Natronomonas salina]
MQFGTEDGVGFVFTDDDPFVGADLDDCRDPDATTTAAWADDIIETLDSFTEVSPSGTGVHVLVAGSLPEGRNRKGDVELYETARFFTVTGDHVAGTPSEIHERTSELESVYETYVAPDEEASDSESQSAVDAGRTVTLTDEELLEKATAAANGEKFERLWRGSTSGYESHSEADMALCSLLAFWTGGDPQQMDRLFRDSGLMRPKWDEQHYADGSTYGEKTIERAIAGTSEFYEPDATTSGGDSAETAPAVDLEDIRAREAERADRIDELEKRLNEVLQEKRELQDELERERARRKELEAELDSIRSEEASLFNWF